jgi:hypothetical protein
VQVGGARAPRARNNEVMSPTSPDNGVIFVGEKSKCLGGFFIKPVKVMLHYL